MKATKLKNLINALTPIEERSDVFGALDKELANVADKLKEAVKAKSMEQVDNEFRKLKSAFKSIVNAFDELKNDLSQREADLLEKINAKNEQIVKILDTTVENEKSGIQTSHAELLKEQNDLKEKFSKIARISTHLMEAYKTEIGNVETRANDLIGEFQNNFEKGNEDIEKQVKELKDETVLAKEAIEKLKKELNQRLGQHGGGNANRNITMNANSVLGRYTDINFLNSSTVGWTTTIDNNTGRVNFMASVLSSGGAGVPTGGSASMLLIKQSSTDGNASWMGVSGDVTIGATGVTSVKSGLKTVQVAVTLDGQGGVISTGLKGFTTIPYSGTITGWQLFADQSGSIVIDVWKDVYASFPPTVADTITGSEKPTLSSVQNNQDLTLTTWTTAVATNDILAINVDSASTVTRCTLVIYITKT